MPVWEGRVRNGFVRLHFMTNVPALEAGSGVPLVIIPGTAESAEDYVELMEALTPHPCFALSLRGRGQSGSPTAGYTLADHVSDIEALVDALDPPPFCLMGYSRGVAYSLGYAARHPGRLAGLILGDYPARHPALSPAWVERFLDSTCRGMLVSERMMRHVVEGLQRESEDEALWDLLPAIPCPTLIMYGGLSGSFLPLPDVERYLKLLPDARVQRFEDSGHILWEPDYGQFVVAVGRFLQRLDGLSGA